MQAFPYHWHHYEEYGATKLRIFCLSGKNESIYIEIDDFLPYIYVELPTDKTWSPASLSVVQTKLKEMSFNSIVKMEFVSKKKLYFAKKDKTETGEYVDKTYPFLKCFFKTTTNIRTFSYKLRQPIFFSGSKITLKIHEADANPVLQFMCMMDIKPASWFAFKGKKRESEDERESVCDHEFLCSYRHFAPIDNKGKVPARPYILSFDIEVNSHNPNVFPQSSQPEDKVFQISCVFARNGDPEDKFEKYILTLCKNKKGEIVDLNMDKLGDGIEVLGYETEGQLLEGFKDLVLEKNPQIICGYNIFSFDILYLYERSKVCNIERQFTQFSCMRGVPCKMKEISWSSSAFKNQEFKYLDAHGRLWIDLLPIIQRDYKLENYKLKTVSDQFLAASKDPLTPKGIFKCYRMFTSDSLALVGKYCVQDSNLVLKLFEKLQIWIGLCEMSNTCNTPMFTLFTQGQQIKIFSQVYKKCMADNIVIDKDSFVTNESDRFTGAYVFPPVPGLYEMVVSFDFSSLYPSTIISNNIDYSTLVLDPSIPDEKCHVIEWEEHINCACPGAEIKTTKKEVVCDKQRHRFMKEPMGVLPTLLKNLLDARKRTNAEMKQMTIELEEMTDKASAAYDDKKRMITVLDKRQLSYKVSANSVAPNTPIPCIDADGTFMYLTMEEISDTLWVSDDDLNEVSKPRKGLSVWTEKGFTPIKYVIRHPIRTPLKRVLTHTGCVDVTEEHSLLDENAKEVRTIDVSIGDKLLHASLPLPSDTPKTPAPIALATKNEKAFLWGSFFATETVSEDTHLFYDVRGSIRIPSSIFSADLHTRQSFFMGYFANTKNATDLVFAVKGEIGSAGLCYLLKTLGYSVCIQLMEDNVYILDCSATPVMMTSIKSIVNSPILNTTEYIYDIETENHHFAAGVGDLIVHNSMYGGMGTRKGYLPFLYGATCTTAKGRQSIEKASKFLVENYGAKLIYGDSVTGDTPILVRYEDQTVDILRIDEIGEVWKNYDEFKSDDVDSNRREKEQTLPFVSTGAFRIMNILEVWTGDCWSRVRRVIRHKTVKKMFRVLTHTGCVDVTEDHSLLDKDKNKIKPTELSIGSELYHSFPPKEDFLEMEIKDAIIEGKVYECVQCKEHKLEFEFYKNYKKICKECVFKKNHEKERKTHNTEYVSETDYTCNPSEHLCDDLAYVWGVFFAEGSCGKYKTKTGFKNSWAINNQDLELLEKCKTILEKCEPLFGWKILDTMKSSNVYKLVPLGHLSFIVNKWRRLFYDKEGYKKVPYFILNASDSMKIDFFNGYYIGDGDRHTFERIHQYKFDIKGKIGAHGLYTLLHSLGFTVAMNTHTDKENIYTLHTCEIFRANPDAVKKIIALPDTKADDYVYDIETESGRFLGGVGRIILKNTDSCYINFSEYADKTKAKDLDSFCRQVESEISSLFPKPMKFAYEEQIYWRYLILTKKRYMALKCDLDGNVDNKIAKRGVLLSRRDNSKYIRDTYANTILKSFYREDLDVVLMKLFEDVKKLCVNALPVKDLVVTKGIGAIADYKIRPLHVDDKKCKKRLQELGLYHEEANMDVLRNIITAFGRKEDVEDESYLHNLEYLIFKEYVKLSLPAQIQLAERMRARGSHVSAGERLGYVITQNGDKLGEKMEDTDYFKEHAESLKIDYLYYMKLMINPFDEVLETVYGEKDLFKKFYKTREQFKKVMDQLHKLFMPKLRFVE
jgi:DNA polymerase elongation subunit (family B)